MLVIQRLIIKLKSEIKIKKFSQFESLIQEKLMDIDEDVNLIYDRYFKSDYEEIEKTGIITSDMFKRFETDTIILKSELSKRADVLNPCRIFINQSRNFYKPSARLISIGINKNAVDYVLANDGNIKLAASYLDQDDFIKFNREFKESTIKGSIHHELVHWIDDSLHNYHITKKLAQPDEPNNSKYIDRSLVNSTKMEIQAQIHNIKQLKNKYNEDWDNLSFYDMIKLSPMLMIIYDKLKGEVLNKWIRDIMNRMYREGLLGKSIIFN